MPTNPLPVKQFTALSPDAQRAIEFFLDPSDGGYHPEAIVSNEEAFSWMWANLAFVDLTTAQRLLSQTPRTRFLDLLAQTCQYAQDFNESHDRGMESIWNFALVARPPHYDNHTRTGDAKLNLANFLKAHVFPKSERNSGSRHLNLATYHYSGSIVGKLYTLEGDWLAKIPLEGLDQPEILKLANHKNRKIRYGVADRATPYDHPTVLLKLLGDADERVAKLAEAKMASFLGAQNLVAGSAIRLPSSPNWLAWPNAVPHPESFLLPDELLQQNFILFHETGDGYCFQALEESTDFVKLVNQPLQLTRKKAAELAKIKLVYPANPRALQGPSVLALEVRSGAHRCQLWEADNGRPRGWTSFWDLQADQKIRPEDWLDPASPDMRILEYLQRNARHLASVGLTL